MTRLSDFAFAAAASILDRSYLGRSVLGARHGLRIVYYHRINAKQVPYYFGGGISPRVFQKQLDHLHKSFNIISVSEAVTRIQQGQNLNGCVCLTFDDGFRECYTHIFPALKQRGIRATFFLIEACLNNQALMWRNKVLAVKNRLSDQRVSDILMDLKVGDSEEVPHADLMSLSWNWPTEQKETLAEQLWSTANMPALDTFLERHKPYLSDSEVLEMISDGQEIGVHTRTHPVCSRLTTDQVDDEIIWSWQRLSDRFNVPINAFSHPFGVRCTLEMEQRILAHTGLEALTGIRDSLSNGSNTAQWERRGMESDYERSITLFYLGPWRRKIASQNTDRSES